MIENAFNTAEKLSSALKKIIRGREDTIKLVLTGLLSDGHVLLEDYPGSGKTTLAKTLGKLIDCSVTDQQLGIVPFRRIQFTPDLLPADVLGVNVFDPKSTSFHFQKGPIFAHVVLADEINRTGPKVQSAFLECMAERQVTIDNTTYPLDDLFFVIGTQNPLDLAGTYPLPLVQLDRFLLKIPMKYVDSETEFEILKDEQDINQSMQTTSPVVTRSEVLEARAAVSKINIDESILRAIVNLVQATRSDNSLQFGASTRAAIMLKRAVASWALLEGRDYANADDLKAVAPYVLKHRLKFNSSIGDSNDAFQNLLNEQIELLVRI